LSSSRVWKRQSRGCSNPIAKLSGRGAASRAKKADKELRDGITPKKHCRNSKEISDPKCAFDDDVQREIDEEIFSRKHGDSLGGRKMFELPKTSKCLICNEAHGLALLETIRGIGARIRERCPASGTLKVRVELQIDSARGHSTAEGHGNFQKLAQLCFLTSMLSSSNNPATYPCSTSLLPAQHALRLEVDKVIGEERQREETLVEV
jgi:hypothetical protein